MEDFKWTDSLVKEFQIFYNKIPYAITGIDPIKKGIEMFKESKDKKEYEVLSFKHKGLSYTKWHDEFYHRTYGKYYNTSLNHVPQNAEILSVKRLYDGEVFSVDEKVYLKASDGKGVFYIRKFSIKDGQCFASSGINIMQLEKVKEVLFTTEDGKEVYNEDNVFLLCTKTWHKSPAISAPKDPFSDDGRIKYFSTEKAREEYILMNKPILSLNDLIIVWDGDRLVGLSENYKSSPMFQRFKELAKSKL